MRRQAAALAARDAEPIQRRQSMMIPEYAVLPANAFIESTIIHVYVLFPIQETLLPSRAVLPTVRSVAIRLDPVNASSSASTRYRIAS